ncbi:hypothetical protein HaLaN_24375 [Haematococcus lacustris]|uniref:Uncharacterized protein n=1 Tax=Haematococcus lacustris TaxID=44745 RepID=A0A6A0A2E1_HAELA|nr:hypothetical protein HaLaN_24375 [Haematococcus lacustris]
MVWQHCAGHRAVKVVDEMCLPYVGEHSRATGYESLVGQDHMTRVTWPLVRVTWPPVAVHIQETSTAHRSQKGHPRHWLHPHGSRDNFLTHFCTDEAADVDGIADWPMDWERDRDGGFMLNTDGTLWLLRNHERQELVKSHGWQEKESEG